MSETPTPDAPPAEGGDEGTQQTFTKAQVDELIQAEVTRVVKKKAEDLYRRRVGDDDLDALRAKASASTTLEERVAGLEAAANAAEQRALRAEIADELLADIGAAKKTGNHNPREGANPQAGDDPMRAFAKGLFARATSE
jgi:ATP-dependent helicase YprA (DUF1998 family)